MNPTKKDKKKVARIVGLCSPPLRRRYLCATPEEREALRPVVDQESGWILERMRRKGYELEGTVAGVLGVFTRGQARGTLELRREPAAVTA
ncbi:MAG: hypothetical protein ACYTGC_18220 [Planctomycetota bacterium]